MYAWHKVLTEEGRPDILVLRDDTGTFDLRWLFLAVDGELCECRVRYTDAAERDELFDSATYMSAEATLRRLLDAAGSIDLLG